jgi:hypothetical protein
MNHRRNVSKALGLSILAALCSTIIVSNAQAGDGEWLIEGETVSSLLPSEVAIMGEGEGVATLHVLKFNIKIKCESTEISGGMIYSGGHTSGNIKFSGCEVLDKNELPMGVCTVDPTQANVLGLLIKHNGAGYVLFTPQLGETFTTIQMLGAECPLPIEASVRGSVVAAIKVKDQVSNLISTKSSLELFKSHVLQYGAHIAHLDLDATVQLRFLHAGQKWGYHLS